MKQPISQVFNVDCVEYMRGLPDNFADIAIVDPPYKIASKTNKVGSRIDKSGKMNSWNNEPPTPEYFKELFRVSKDQIIWGANNYEGLPRTEYFAIWNKCQTVDNFASLEYAWISMGIGKPAKMFTYSIHKHNQTKGDKIHPTMKAIELYKWLLKNYAKSGDVILDTHMGSQSSRIACHEMGFDFYGCEIDPDYFKSGCDRFDKETQTVNLFHLLS